jgi:hypothetical protein
MSAGQRWGVIALLLAAVILGVVVEWRSAFLRRRMTDLVCYLRGAWAVRAGADLYAVTEDSGWHYNYPPFLAILLGPLAEPPPDAAPMTALPYPVSVAVWYAAGVVALILAVHLCAAAVETGLARPPRRYGYSWWSLRLVPLALILPAAGRTLSRGQVNTIVLALLAGWAAGLVTGRRARAGVCLAFAICIKVIPAFLILHPLWQRDRRCLAGLALGLVLGLIVLPVLASGPERALAQAKHFIEATLRPGLGADGDGTRGEELTDMTTTDSQSILYVLHNYCFVNPWARDPVAATWTRVAHWSISGLLTLLTLAVLGRRPTTPRNELAFIGALTTIMAVTSPVCHLHYFVFALPLVTAVYAGPRRWQTSEALAFFLLANVASLLPSLATRMYGLTTMGALVLWASALLREPKSADVQPIHELPAPDNSYPAPHAA